MFSKAAVKRFNDTTGCAPPVGSYNPKNESSVHGVCLEKTERFKQPKDVGPDCTSTPSKSSRSLLRGDSWRINTPNRRSRKNFTCSSICSELNTTQPEVSQLKGDLQSNCKKVAALEEEIKRLSAEKDHLEQQILEIPQLKVELDAATQKEAEALKKLSEVEEDRKRLLINKEHLEHLNQEFTQLKDDVQAAILGEIEALGKLTDVEKDRKQILDDKEHLEHQLKADLQTLAHRESEALRKLSEVDEERKRLLEEKEHLEHQCQKMTQLKADLQEVSQRETEALRKLSEVEEDRSDIRCMLLADKDRLEHLTHEIAELKADLQTAIQREAELFNKLSEAEEDKNRLLGENEQLQHLNLEVAQLKEDLQAAAQKEVEALKKLSNAEADRNRLLTCLERQDLEVAQLKANLDAATQRETETLRQLLDTGEAHQRLLVDKESLEQQCLEIVQLKMVLQESTQREAEALQKLSEEERKRLLVEKESVESQKFAQMKADLQAASQALGELSGIEEDRNRWKANYEELLERVGPFMDELDAFASERDLLLGRSKMAEAEMSQLMDKYAKLLGHQNQRQKIKYINKMKVEFMNCRKEKEELKEKARRQELTIQKLEWKISTLTQTRSPLKQANK